MTDTDPEARPSRRIGYDLLRVISICAVVAVHTFGPLAANPAIHGTAPWALSVLLSSGSIWAVPVFVMLAGALSLRERAHENGPQSFYLRRAIRIVPALIAWTLVYLILVRVIFLREVISPTDAVIEVIDARTYPHLYFLWLIAGLYIAAPVLAAFLHGGGRRRAAIMGATTLAFTLLIFMIPAVLGLKGLRQPIQLGALTFWLAYTGYFLVGYALSLFRYSRKSLGLAGLGIVVFGGITLAETVWPSQLAVLRAILLPEYLGAGVAALSICVYILGVTVLDRIRAGAQAARYVRTLSETSFGVFLVHLVVMLVPYQLLGGYHDRTSVLEAVLAYVFVMVVSFAISIGARKVPLLRAIF